MSSVLHPGDMIRMPSGTICEVMAINDASITVRVRQKSKDFPEYGESIGHTFQISLNAHVEVIQLALIEED